MEKKGDKLLYMQLYEYYRRLILEGKMAEGTKLPSIRVCAAQFEISRTTAEMAYMLLAADGYIISKPQSGYYVTGLWQQHESQKEQVRENKRQSVRESCIYADYSKTAGGQESFNLDLWRRYIKSALRQSDRLLNYGDPQGEEDLREVLSSYLRETRGVVCTADNLIIGAGFQSLLQVLCPLMKNCRKAAFMDALFKQGQAVFEDYQFEIETEWSRREKSDLLYITPSHLNRWGEVMPVDKRFKMIAEAKKLSQIIIEDDYDSEFAYLNRPAPALQGLAGGKNVIYIGTFSRVLLPSIRISFMILPDELAEQYQSRKMLYHQTVSKAEQIALCQYIRDGHLQAQIRKTRKNYEEKIGRFYRMTEEMLKDSPQVFSISGKNILAVRLYLESQKICSTVFEKMKEQGILVGQFSDKGGAGIYLACAGVSEKYWKDHLLLLQEYLKL